MRFNRRKFLQIAWLAAAGAVCYWRFGKWTGGMARRRYPGSIIPLNHESVKHHGRWLG